MLLMAQPREERESNKRKKVENFSEKETSGAANGVSCLRSQHWGS
jgi:hypothetical protein